MSSTLGPCKALLLLALVGCGDDLGAGPTVSITPFGGTWTDEDMSSLVRGAHAWERLGFRYAIDPDESSTLDVCPRDWWSTGVTECRIRVGVQQVPDADLPPGSAAYTDRTSGTVSIGARFHGEYLRHLAAHELGHVLLNTGQHLGPNVPGIMQSGSDLVEPTEEDLALACISIDICVD